MSKMKMAWRAAALSMLVLGACAHGAASDSASTDSGQETMVARVYFLSEPNMARGIDPLLLSVERVVSKVTPARGVLDAMFRGPTDAERAQGLTFVSSGVTGFHKLRIENGVAHVHLKGHCNSGGATVTIANLINATLKQFPSVLHVRIYDSKGHTQQPNGPGDSIPTCLEP
ncbi:MAG: GerMN domain-containing protein [Myxococcales bacterium]|nr:GerMN domain-containing protein [Myxococcales bacterium]